MGRLYSKAFIENEDAYAAAIERNIKANAAKTRRKAFELRERSAEVSDFLCESSMGTGFIQSMYDALFEWGNLTDGQYAAVLKIIEKRSEQKKQFDALKAKSSYLGTVGDRVEITAEIVAAFSFETNFGTTSGRIMRSGDDVIVWMGSGDFGYAQKGDRVTFFAKVKKHALRDGEKQTTVTRPTKVSINGWAMADINSNWNDFSMARDALQNTPTNQTIN